MIDPEENNHLHFENVNGETNEYEEPLDDNADIDADYYDNDEEDYDDDDRIIGEYRGTNLNSLFSKIKLGRTLTKLFRIGILSLQISFGNMYTKLAKNLILTFLKRTTLFKISKKDFKIMRIHNLLFIL